MTILVAAQKCVYIAVLRINFAGEHREVLLCGLAVGAAVQVVQVETAGVHQRAVLAVDGNEVRQRLELVV